MPAPIIQLKPANVQTISIKNWQKGVITAYDTPRTPTGALYSTTNTILQQDGTVRPRPSLMPYGAQPLGIVLGEIYEFRNTTVLPMLNYRICMQLVSGTAKVYISKDTGAWTAISGKTYDTAAKAHFCQIDNKVLVMNGVDNLSYYDIKTGAITPFTALTTPTAPTLTTNTGLTGSTFTITYRISANSSVGQSIASSALSTTVGTDHDLWNATTQSLKIDWTAVTGAVSYNVYMGTGGVGTEFLIASGITGTSYTDNGTAYQDTTHSYPLVDSTAGPKATRGDVINDQVFLSGIKDSPYNIIVGGNFPYSVDFSPANGGNTVPVGNGGKAIPVRVRLTTGTNGSSSIKVYCSGPNGKAPRYTLTPDSITVGNQSVNIFNVKQDDGEEGTDSPDAMLYYNNANYYPSIDGFKTDGVLPQLQTFISTRRVSNSIQQDIASLNSEAMGGAVAMQYEGRLLYALPVNATSNNQIWPLDLDRGGAWMKPWNISADWMMQYNSNTIAEGGDGHTHYTVLSNNVISELTYIQSTNDNGVAVTLSLIHI